MSDSPLIAIVLPSRMATLVICPDGRWWPVDEDDEVVISSCVEVARDDNEELDYQDRRLES